MAHVTDLHLLRGHRPMILHEQRCVYVSPVGYVFIGFIMAICTVVEVFTFLFRVNSRRSPPLLRTSTCPYQTDHTANQTYTQDIFFIHRALPKLIFNLDHGHNSDVGIIIGIRTIISRDLDFHRIIQDFTSTTG